MKLIKNSILGLVLCFKVFALAPQVELEVWTNEAIVNIYQFNDKNWPARQIDIGQYFTADAWKKYLDAMQKSNILKQVQEKHYDVSAVATLPPSIHSIDAKNWEAKMPILVQFKNETDTQIQNLEIKLRIVQLGEGGVRGYAILQFEAKPLNEPCACHAAYQAKISIV